MAGQVAHICLVNSTCTAAGLEQIADLTPSIRRALVNDAPFCRLGAVSPDCPSVVESTDAAGWNGIMHDLRPADFVRYGIPKVLEMSFNTAEARACIAWLFGYASHLVADCTIHPVVMKRVGPYSIKSNRTAHRRCELDQDAYIFFKLTGREVLDTDFLQFTGLGECGVKGNTNNLNPAIASLWAYCLRQYLRWETKPYVRFPGSSLNPGVWFATYVNAMENFAARNSAFARLMGMQYRRSDQVDASYLENLPVPHSSTTIHYEDLFARTRENLIQAWTELARALHKDDPSLFRLPNANLDTGQDQAGRFIYWS